MIEREQEIATREYEEQLRRNLDKEEEKEECQKIRNQLTSFYGVY